MNILEVKNLEVILKKNNKKIIKNINFSIEKNSCVGILGESGSGKSITCKSILNILNDNFNINDCRWLYRGNCWGNKNTKINFLRQKC